MGANKQGSPANEESAIQGTYRPRQAKAESKMNPGRKRNDAMSRRNLIHNN